MPSHWSRMARRSTARHRDEQCEPSANVKRSMPINPAGLGVVPEFSARTAKTLGPVFNAASHRRRRLRGSFRLPESVRRSGKREAVVGRHLKSGGSHLAICRDGKLPAEEHSACWRGLGRAALPMPDPACFGDRRGIGRIASAQRFAPDDPPAAVTSITAFRLHAHTPPQSLGVASDFLVACRIIHQARRLAWGIPDAVAPALTRACTLRCSSGVIVWTLARTSVDKQRRGNTMRPCALPPASGAPGLCTRRSCSRAGQACDGSRQGGDRRLKYVGRSLRHEVEPIGDVRPVGASVAEGEIAVIRASSGHQVCPRSQWTP